MIENLHSWVDIYTPELKKSRAYELIQQTQKDGLKLFRENFHIK